MLVNFINQYALHTVTHVEWRAILSYEDGGRWEEAGGQRVLVGPDKAQHEQQPQGPLCNTPPLLIPEYIPYIPMNLDKLYLL